MFGRAKGNSRENDTTLPGAPQLQNLSAILENARLLKEQHQRNTNLTEDSKTEVLKTEELEQPTATSEVLQATESDTSEISCIDPGMTVVGKMSSAGTLNVFGRVEGELHASIVRISNGAQVEGTIAAQELTIGGRFKGTIQANRVTLTSSAVVEGEIHHRSLVIEENAWFAGVSRPEEVSASQVTNPSSPIQDVPTNGNRQVNGSLDTATS